jgi:hypothetical protein
VRDLAEKCYQLSGRALSLVEISVPEMTGGKSLQAVTKEK